jgi:hypothetical protein
MLQFLPKPLKVTVASLRSNFQWFNHNPIANVSLLKNASLLFFIFLNLNFQFGIADFGQDLFLLAFDYLKILSLVFFNLLFLKFVDFNLFFFVKRLLHFLIGAGFALDARFLLLRWFLLEFVDNFDQLCHLPRFEMVGIVRIAWDKELQEVLRVESSLDYLLFQVVLLVCDIVFHPLDY